MGAAHTIFKFFVLQLATCAVTNLQKYSKGSNSTDNSACRCATLCWCIFFNGEITFVSYSCSFCLFFWVNCSSFMLLIIKKMFLSPLHYMYYSTSCPEYRHIINRVALSVNLTELFCRCFSLGYIQVLHTFVFTQDGSPEPLESCSVTILTVKLKVNMVKFTISSIFM